MILQVNPESAWWVRDAASSALMLHIGAAAAGLLAGTVCLLFRKGATLHRRAGDVFTVSMLTMAAIGGCVAPLLPQRSSVVPAIVTFYLVATGWLAARRRQPARSKSAHCSWP